MIGYRDMTWCSRAGQDCTNEMCGRYLTDKVRDEAITWWGDAHFPIWYGDMKTDTCGYKEKQYVFSKTEKRTIRSSPEDTKRYEPPRTT